MKLLPSQFIRYDMLQMKYRLGRRARFYRLRHARRAKHLAWGVSGLAMAGLVGITLLPHSVPQALGLGRFSRLLPVLVGSPSTTGPGRHGANKTGSSTPPPKGTTASAAADTVNTGAGSVATAAGSGCGSLPPIHAGLASSPVTELRKLAQYEQVCHGALAERSSFFVPTPATTTQAHDSANDVAATLKAYAQVGIKPLVFIEPNDLNGNNLNLAQYANGAYDSALDAYFASIKAAGVTDQQMGMWVLVPEGNLPEWTTTDPNTYAAVVTKTAQFQKKYFPASQSSVMLDSETYPPGSSWGDGSFVSLVPYVQSIPKGLIDSFGLQGFPWAGPANQPPNTFYDPSAYLRMDFAIEAAHTLGVNNLWVNTGTFHQMYADQPAQAVTLSPSQRQTMLEGVIQEVAQAKAQGFTVAIHLFAENKAKTSEAIDWSYWPGQPDGGANQAVFTAFAHDANAAGLPIWLFDSTE